MVLKSDKISPWRWCSERRNM